MVNRIPITQARTNLGALVKRAHLQGEYFILEKDGIPIAGLMSANEFEDYLELQDPTVNKQIAESSEDFRAGRFRPVEKLITELSNGRRPKKATRKQT